jgi:hypothetical protein
MIFLNPSFSLIPSLLFFVSVSLLMTYHIAFPNYSFYSIVVTWITLSSIPFWLFIVLLLIDQQNGKKNNSARLLISASATVGALLLVALMCFWGCFLYKKFGKNDRVSLAMDVGPGTLLIFLWLAHIPVSASFFYLCVSRYSES